MASFKAETHQLEELGRDFAAVATGLSVDLPGVLASSARELAGIARETALSYPSTSVDRGGATEAVAASIRARAQRRLEWRVEAVGQALGGLWELGNKGSDPDAATFRHPTFGNQPWVSQRKWRFLTMALDEYAPVFAKRVVGTVDRTLRRFRL